MSRLRWTPDPHWRSAGRAERAEMGEYELAAYALPGLYGWEVCGGPGHADLLAKGEADSLAAAKRAAKAAARRHRRRARAAEPEAEPEPEPEPEPVEFSPRAVVATMAARDRNHRFPMPKARAKRLD